MKIVASTKLTRAQRAMRDAGKYGRTSGKVFESAETKALEGENKKVLYIVCTSDKGLCGGVHSSLSRYIRRNIGPGKESADLVLIGEKARAQLSRSNSSDIVLSFAGIGKDVPSFADAQSIADQIIQLPGDYAEVKILHNKFINASSYEATIIPGYSEDAITASPNFSAFEVDEALIGNMREYSLANSLYWALAEGHACEISARRNAMDVSISREMLTGEHGLTWFQNASKNAGEMINKYQILYNRTRQAVITGELVEIITGAMASEDM